MKITFNEAYDLLTKGRTFDKDVTRKVRTKSGDAIIIFSFQSKKYLLICNLNQGAYKSYDFILDCSEV